MQRELLLRTVSAVILAAVVLFLTWRGGTGFRLLVVAMIVLLFFEWYRIVASRRMSQLVWILGCLATAGIVTALLAGLHSVGLLVCIVGAVIVAVVRIRERADVAPSVGLLYAGLFGEALIGIRESEPDGLGAVVFIFVIIWATDILAYFGGRSFAGPRLAPAISPNKTWSGFVCGLLGGILGGSITAWLFGSHNLLWIGLLAAFLSLVGQIGDLFESGFKRRFAVKDSSHIIPGHGGAMDRLDSLVFATLAAYIVAMIAGTMPQTGGFDSLSAILLRR